MTSWGDSRSSGREPVREGEVVRRHGVSTRIWHWVNVFALIIMLMSGLMIFNAHPRLYWGEYGANYDYAWLEIDNRGDVGFMRIGDVTVPTTGVLGAWTDSEGRTQTRAFPDWATIPSYYSLAMGRRWHLTFAWLFAVGILAYLVASLVNGHLRRGLLPNGSELRPGHIWRDILRHAKLDLPKGEAARSYNILQKLTYLAVVVVLIPVIVLTGLTMSPWIDASLPWLLDLFGGRQSARSIHFIAATLLVLFVLVHLVMVVLAGPINGLRSMITGRFRLPKEKSR